MSDNSYGETLRSITNAVRTGPLGDMRAATELTPADLRAGAERCELDAAFRRQIAEDMERRGVRTVSAAYAAMVLRERERRL